MSVPTLPKIFRPLPEIFHLAVCWIPVTWVDPDNYASVAPDKVRKRAKIRNRYNHAPHPTKDTNGKVTTSKLDITNKSREVSPFPAGDHKASTDVHESITKQDRNNINDPQKKHCLGMVSKIL